MRVISMVPSWTETLLECGVEVVGRTNFCIHPQPSIKAIPRVGGTKNIDWRKVNSLSADLLLLDQEENPKSMADESPLPLHVTHVRGVEDMPRELTALADRLNNSKLRDLALRWEKVNQYPCFQCSLSELPGVLEWIKPWTADQEIKSLVYLIWKDPWMAVSQQTFIGSVFQRLGWGKEFLSTPQPYPQIDLAQFNPEETVLLFSSEPYPFHKHKTLIQELPFSSALVNGESFSWFGLRSLRFLERCFSTVKK